jgi:FkbM family methyltransferase
MVGPLAWLVLPSRLPPRGGLLGTPLARRLITIRFRDGRKLRCRIEEFEGYWAVFLRRSYDFPGIRWPAVRSVVDVGANIGAATLWFAGQAPLARVVAVEPDPQVWPLLKENVEANQLQGRVQIVQAAMGATSGTARLAPGRYSIETRLAPTATDQGHVATVMTLAELLEQARMPAVDVLKLDCEGVEYDVLLSAGDSVLGRIGAIVGEYHPVVGRERQDLHRCLSSAGFRTSFHGNGSQGTFSAVRPGAGVAAG